MTDRTADIAPIIDAHRIDSTWSRWLSGEEQVGDETIRCLCDCGEELDLDDHGAHVVAVIRDSGLTVIALPDAQKQAEFIQDIATHGIGADLHPTRCWDGDQTSEYRWWSDYIGGADSSLRRSAAAIRDPAPHSQGEIAP